LLILQWIGTSFAQNLFNLLKKVIFMKQSKPKKTPFEKQQLVIQKCKDKILTDEFIAKYQNSTKGAIEQILNMGESVLEVYELSKDGYLNEYDLNYFCMNVGINQKSSTFRKYKAIGDNAGKFRECMDKLPSAFSVLYELATLEADLFEKIVINGEFGKNLTLKQVRQLANKGNASVPNKNNSITNLPTYVHPAQVSGVLKKINRFVIHISSSVKESELNSIVKMFDDFQKSGVLRYEMPEITEFVDDDDADDQLQLAA
jgi:hypothetical protein